MFELLSNVQSVPIDQDSLVMVHRGMNKVRVSVGEHSSEPSEVYIITGQSNGNLESYVIFYMLEPGIHVVYGFDQNPYAPDQKGQVVEEAVVFVEEMGSILEEIPWETMTPDQRSAWFGKEILYSEPVTEQLEELQELAELEEVQEIEAVEYVEIDAEEHDEAALQDDPVFVTVDEVEKNSGIEDEPDLTDNGPDETPPIPEDETPPISENVEEAAADMVSEPDEIDEDDVDGIDAAGMEDVVVAEEDFDELLKQAFLKPDVAEKTKLKKRKRAPVVVEESPASEEPAVSEEDEWPVEEETEQPEAVQSVATEKEEEQEVSAEPEATDEVVVEWAPEEMALGAGKATAGNNGDILSEKNTRIGIIRFLSRF
jgi:hypothetical protein